MARKYVIELDNDEQIEAEKRYGAKNVNYEIGKAFRANLKRIKAIESAKEFSRANKRKAAE